MGEQDQAAAPYAAALLRHRDRVRHRVMIPGHAANQYRGAARLEAFLGERALSLDIPQMIDGIDIGPAPAFAAARELAARAWDARTTWFLTNGASQGNRMAMVALAALGQRVLIQRSAHSSVYDGLVMSGLEPGYAMPEIDPEHGIAHGVTAAGIDDALARAAAAGRPYAGVAIVSPSYFGAVADVPAIAEVCRAHRAALIVDASWGAHFGFHPDLPESPTRQGADIVLSSVHKLGGSLTQTAMLHLVEGPHADALAPALEAAYLLTESTSLNSLLLASLDLARSELATGTAGLDASIAAAAELRRAVDRDPVLRLAERDFRAGRASVTGLDPLHVAIDVRGTGVGGPQLKHRLQLGPDAAFFEIAAPTALVALIGAGSAPDAAACAELVGAIRRSATSTSAADPAEQNRSAGPPPQPGAAVRTPREAFFARRELIDARRAVGRVAAEMLAAYPPGIPNIVPGETVTAEAVAYLQRVAALPGGHVRGAADPTLARLSVLA